MKVFVLALSLVAAPAFAGELCKLAAEPDSEGNNVCAPSNELGAGTSGIAGGVSLEFEIPVPTSDKPVKGKFKWEYGDKKKPVDTKKPKQQHKKATPKPKGKK
jgi:hypothetical protein